MAELTPYKAIRKYCTFKCMNTLKEVRLCDNAECPLHSFRKGSNPNRHRTGGFKRIKSKNRSRVRKNEVKQGIVAGLSDNFTVPDDYEVIIRKKEKVNDKKR